LTGVGSASFSTPRRNTPAQQLGCSFFMRTDARSSASSIDLSLRAPSRGAAGAFVTVLVRSGSCPITGLSQCVGDLQ
jgi:hypothetical protein